MERLRTGVGESAPDESSAVASPEAALRRRPPSLIYVIDARGQPYLASHQLAGGGARGVPREILETVRSLAAHGAGATCSRIAVLSTGPMLIRMVDLEGSTGGYRAVFVDPYEVRSGDDDRAP